MVVSRQLRVVEREAHPVGVASVPARPRAVLGVSDRRIARTVARVIRAVGADVVVAATPEDVARTLERGVERSVDPERVEPERVDLVVCDLNGGDGTAALAPLLRARALPPLVLLNAHLIQPALADMLAGIGVPHLIARVAGRATLEVAELLVTLRKILDRDIFGVEKYLRWGAELRSCRVTTTQQKRDALDGLGDFLAEFDVDARLAAHIMTIGDELLMNAMFNAPVDGAVRRNASRSRRDPVTLGDAEAAVFEYSSDGRQLAVACRDPFGSLELPRAQQCLARAIRGGITEVASGSGGAGIGLSMVYQAVDQLVINVAPGMSTEFIGIVDLEQGFRERRASPRSVNIFTVGA